MCRKFWIWWYYYYLNYSPTLYHTPFVLRQTITRVSTKGCCRWGHAGGSPRDTHSPHHLLVEEIRFKFGLCSHSNWTVCSWNIGNMQLQIRLSFSICFRICAAWFPCRWSTSQPTKGRSCSRCPFAIELANQVLINTLSLPNHVPCLLLLLESLCCRRLNHWHCKYFN